MTYILESPAANGVKKYVCKAHPPSRSVCLRGAKDEAIRFLTRSHAEVTRSRFSSALGLVITRVEA